MALPDIAMSPPSWAFSSVSFAAAASLRMTSVFCHSAVSRPLEITYFCIPFITLPKSSSACSGEYAADSS